MTTARILITGSRTWPDEAALRQTLADLWHDALQDSHDGIVIVHGTAEGADQMAGHWAREHQVPVEEHAADWDAPCDANCPPGHRRRNRRGIEFCPFAGHRRNQLMVDLGAAVCAAFQRAGSSGTADCMRRSRKAGIPVHAVLRP